MKTTVKLGAGRAVTIEPGEEGVRIAYEIWGVPLEASEITPDQAGALLFGIEQALEAVRVRVK